MDELFITLDPIIDVDPMKIADWCTSPLESNDIVPDEVFSRWNLHDKDKKLDAANLFFVLMIDQDKDGKLRGPLDETGVNREAFGRIPNENSPIDYLCKFLIPKTDNERVLSLLNHLGNRFENHPCKEGLGGAIIRGAISGQETIELRERLVSREWKVDKNESLDGGVAEIVRLLILLLRKAESRKCGVMLREHR